MESAVYTGHQKGFLWGGDIQEELCIKWVKGKKETHRGKEGVCILYLGIYYNLFSTGFFSFFFWTNLSKNSARVLEPIPSKCQLQNACYGPDTMLSGSRTLSPRILTRLQGRCHDLHFASRVTETPGGKKPAQHNRQQVAGLRFTPGSIHLTWPPDVPPPHILNASPPLRCKAALIFTSAVTWDSLLDTLPFLFPFLSCSFGSESPLSGLLHTVRTPSRWAVTGLSWSGVAWTNHLAEQVRRQLRRGQGSEEQVVTLTMTWNSM